MSEQLPLAAAIAELWGRREAQKVSLAAAPDAERRRALWRELMRMDAELSRLDDAYKAQWDQGQGPKRRPARH